MLLVSNGSMGSVSGADDVDTPSRRWLLALLIIWILLGAARLVFDLIGRLWVPVVCNLLQVLICISGVFAASQRRAALLICLSVCFGLSIVYNTLLLLWYNGVFGDAERPLLSAGLPYGYSFFSRHTPLCDSFFNVANGRWTQKDCSLPYNNVESIQAMIHILIALSTIVFTLLFVLERRSAERNIKVAQITLTHSAASGAPVIALSPRSSPKPDDFSSAVTADATNSTDSAEIRQKPTDSFDGSSALYSKLGNRRRSESVRSVSAITDARTQSRSSQKRIAARLANVDSAPFPSVALSKPSSNGNLTSLISFDPKSSTLIRVRAHQNDSEEEEEEEEKTTEKRLPMDSGHPSSSNGIPSPDWTMGGISFPSSRFSPLRSSDYWLSEYRSPALPSDPADYIPSPTSFPIEQFERQRSFAGISLSTAMPLHRPPRERYRRSRSVYECRRESESPDELPPPPPRLRAFHSRTPIEVEGLLV